MDIESLASGVQALILATPNISTFVSSFPGEDGDVVAIFRNRAPQEARTPYIVWHHIVTPVRYDSCGEQSQFESTIQIDFHGSELEEVDEMEREVSAHLSFNSGPFADLTVGAVFLSQSGDEMNEDIETDGDMTSPIRRLDMTIHWTLTS
jgi:hypothetical protein